MKREMIVVLLMLLISPIISAAVTCSDNSAPTSTQKEIPRGSMKVLEGLGAGVFSSSSRSVSDGAMATLVLESTSFDLSNETSSAEFETSSGKHTVSLINASGDSAAINLNGNKKTIIKGELIEIRNFYAILSQSEKTSESVYSAKFVLGTKKISLSTGKTPSANISIKNDSYKIELIGASESNVIAKVTKCTNSKVVEEKVQSNSSSNNTAQIQNTSLSNNLTQQNNTGSLNMSKVNNSSTNNITNTSQLNTEPAIKQNIFKRFFSWFKSLLGF